MTVQLEIGFAQFELRCDFADWFELRGLRNCDITHHAIHTFHPIRAANYTAPSLTDNLLRTRCVEVIETELDTSRTVGSGRASRAGRIRAGGQPQKILENKKMNRTDLLETAAGYLAGITTGFAFVLLYVALATPVVETVEKLLA